MSHLASDGVNGVHSSPSFSFVPPATNGRKLPQEPAPDSKISSRSTLNGATPPPPAKPKGGILRAMTSLFIREKPEPTQEEALLELFKSAGKYEIYLGNEFPLNNKHGFYGPVLQYVEALGGDRESQFKHTHDDFGDLIGKATKAGSGLTGDQVNTLILFLKHAALVCHLKETGKRYREDVDTLPNLDGNAEITRLDAVKVKLNFETLNDGINQTLVEGGQDDTWFFSRTLFLDLSAEQQALKVKKMVVISAFGPVNDIAKAKDEQGQKIGKLLISLGIPSLSDTEYLFQLAPHWNALKKNPEFLALYRQWFHLNKAHNIVVGGPLAFDFSQNIKAPKEAVPDDLVDRQIVFAVGANLNPSNPFPPQEITNFAKQVIGMHQGAPLLQLIKECALTVGVLKNDPRWGSNTAVRDAYTATLREAFVETLIQPAQGEILQTYEKEGTVEPLMTQIIGRLNYISSNPSAERLQDLRQRFIHGLFGREASIVQSMNVLHFHLESLRRARSTGSNPDTPWNEEALPLAQWKTLANFYNTVAKTKVVFPEDANTTMEMAPPKPQAAVKPAASSVFAGTTPKLSAAFPSLPSSKERPVYGIYGQQPVYQPQPPSAYAAPYATYGTARGPSAPYGASYAASQVQEQPEEYEEDFEFVEQDPSPSKSTASDEPVEEDEQPLYPAVQHPKSYYEVYLRNRGLDINDFDYAKEGWGLNFTPRMQARVFNHLMLAEERSFRAKGKDPFGRSLIGSIESAVRNAFVKANVGNKPLLPELRKAKTYYANSGIAVPNSDFRQQAHQAVDQYYQMVHRVKDKDPENLVFAIGKLTDLPGPDATRLARYIREQAKAEEIDLGDDLYYNTGSMMQAVFRILDT